ncbi:MAG: hypothetical protein P1P90_04905 [Patescibacteria group bacterium]|nr:hypothetical protein [Patescibacteria group bacterium]
MRKNLVDLKKGINVIIVVIIWSIIFVSIDGDPSTFWHWLLAAFFCVLLSYTMGRMDVIKQIFEKGELEEIIEEYKNSKNQT